MTDKKLVNILRRMAAADGITVTTAGLMANDGMIHDRVIALANRIVDTPLEPEILMHELSHRYLHVGNVTGSSEAETEAELLAFTMLDFIRNLEAIPADRRQRVIIGGILALTALRQAVDAPQGRNLPK